MSLNRTDRLYALVEELRAFAPRPRTARQLARRFEVSVRTIERDLNALLEAGVPIYSTPGPGGGYAVDKRHTLPPVNFTAAEAAAVAIALSRPGASLLAEALRSVARKVVGVMTAAEAGTAGQLAGRILLFPQDGDVRSTAARVAEEAVVRSEVVQISYEDRHGEATIREVEPLALVGSGQAWYLIGHCRLRDGERAFRLDRIREARLTGEPVPDRGRPTIVDGIPVALRPLALLE